MIAIRSFSKERYSRKPATKLYNCWTAGVPAILGCESAYQQERKSPLDYIEVSNEEELLQGLDKLKKNIIFRHKMVENGRLRAPEVSPEATIKSWVTFLSQEVIPAYQLWVSSPSLRDEFPSLRSFK